MFVAMRGAVLFLVCLWAGAEVAAINPEILADVIQQMRRFGLENRQYAMVVRLTQQQCTDSRAGFNLGVGPRDVQDGLQTENVYIGNRIIAAIPATYHAEYILLENGNNYVGKFLESANADECIVFFSNYSPCLEFCNNPVGHYNIIPLLGDFNRWNANNKAFVFSSVWEPDRFNVQMGNPTSTEVLQSFRRIETYIPVYRCVRFKEVNKCYKCIINTNSENHDCLFGYHTASSTSGATRSVKL